MNELKKGYYHKQVDASFATMKGFYAMFMPVLVPYKKLHDKLVRMNVGVDWSTGMIESAPGFGRGWIGVAVDKQVDVDLPRKDIKGEFVAFDHNGSYKGLAKTWKQIMSDYPNGKEFYSLYLNNPRETAEKDLRTTIIFRI